MKRAEEVDHYYKTSTRSPETWFEMCRNLITKKGGKIIRWANADDSGKEVFIIQFSYGQTQYRMHWNVLPTRGSAIAARRQAVTALYHDIKAALVRAEWFGFDKAFVAWREIGDGRTMSDVTKEEIGSALPKLLPPPKEN